MIDWASESTEVMLNPRFPPEERRRLERIVSELKPLKGHLWLATSGATGPVKLVALSRTACLVSADAVNAHLDAGVRDVWANVLPLFHVGGLGILARAHVSGARVAGDHDAAGSPPAWSPAAFESLVSRHNATLTSLVPAQVHDLVEGNIQCPPSLRAVVVGGGVLPAAVYERGRALGWPLLPSYGATECASQIATASLDRDAAPTLEILPHVEAALTGEGRLRIRSEALFSGYATDASGAVAFQDPRVDGWWTSEDRGTVSGATLTVEGRGEDFFKVGGESVSLPRLEAYLQDVIANLGFPGDAALVAVCETRLGREIRLVVSGGSDEEVTALLEAFNDRVLPFEWARGVHRLPALPRSPLGKLLRGEVLGQIKR